MCEHQAIIPALTAILPFRSDWTTLNAAEPRRSQVREDNRSTREGKMICKKMTHTEKTDEALGSLQEGECVDALIGDGDLCEGLKRRGRSGLGEIKRL